MKIRIIRSFVLIVFVLAFAMLSAASALAFEPPWPDGMPWLTTTPWPTAQPLQVGVPWAPGSSPHVAPVIPTATPTAVSTTIPAAHPLIAATSTPIPLPTVVPTHIAPTPVVPTPVPTSLPVASLAIASAAGSSPDNPLTASGEWRRLDPKSSIWYIIGNDGMHMDVMLSVDPASGASMEVYAPGILHRPVGYGTPYRGDQSHLAWSGGHWNSHGQWLARVVNDSPVAIQYSLNSGQKDISNRSCFSYWEYIGTDYVYWTECNRAP